MGRGREPCKRSWRVKTFMMFDLKRKNNDRVSVKPKEAYLELAWDDLRDAEKSSLLISSYLLKSNSPLITEPEIAR